jgi:hypothetical protein
VDIVDFPLCIFCCEVFDKTDHVDGCSLFVSHQLNGVFGHEFVVLHRKPFMFGKIWCIIGGSVEVLNEVQSILVH